MAAYIFDFTGSFSLHSASITYTGGLQYIHSGTFTPGTALETATESISISTSSVLTWVQYPVFETQTINNVIATVTYYKKRGILFGNYVYWVTTDPTQPYPFGPTMEETIVAVYQQ